jgi:hypothetical protein
MSLLMVVSCDLARANVYFGQPLVTQKANDFGVERRSDSSDLNSNASQLRRGVSREAARWR